MQTLNDMELKRKLFRDLKTGQIIYGFKEELKQLDGSLKKDPKAHYGTASRPFVVIGKKNNNEVIVVNAKLMSDIFDISEKEGIPLELAVLEIESNNDTAGDWFDLNKHIGYNDRGEKVYKLNANEVNNLKRKVSALNLSIVQTVSFEEFSSVCGRLNNKDFYNMIFSLDQALVDFIEIINMPEDNGTVVEKVLESKLIEQFSIYEPAEDFSVSIDVEYDNYDGLDYIVATSPFCGTLFYNYYVDDKEFAAVWNFDSYRLQFGTALNDEYDCVVDTYDGTIDYSDYEVDDVEYFVPVFYELAYDFIKNYIFTYEIDIHDVVFYDNYYKI